MNKYMSAACRLRSICWVRIAIAPLAVPLIASQLACSVLDEELYHHAEEHAEETATDSGTAGAGIAVEIGSNRCPVPEDDIISSNDETVSGLVSLSTLSDDIQDCGKLTGFDGPDGVIGIELAAGERVHVEAKFATVPGEVAPDVDIGVYLMDGCDPTTCLKRVERCPAGKGEHFAWSTDTQGTYFFGFDTKAYDADLLDPTLEVTVTFPHCGNRELEPGETCDDGNQELGDGCDDECNGELSDANGTVPVELEPNNYYRTGNVLLVGVDEKIQVKGHIGGSCDLDFYFVDIPEGGFARARLLGEDGQECTSGAPTLVLEFDDPTGAAELGKAKIPADEGGSNHCPEWDETSFATNALPAGRYVIEMKPPDQGVGIDPFPYILEVEIVGPPPPQ